ncbi:MAG: hypothetical protein WC635_03550 [Bacteriovorax sp.]|jgi:hypothetical protein
MNRLKLLLILMALIVGIGPINTARAGLFGRSLSEAIKDGQKKFDDLKVAYKCESEEGMDIKENPSQQCRSLAELQGALASDDTKGKKDKIEAALKKIETQEKDAAKFESSQRALKKLKGAQTLMNPNGRMPVEAQ